MFSQISYQHPVVILGLGLTGAACVRYCLKKDWPMMVMDSREEPTLFESFKQQYPTIELKLGDFSESTLLNAGLIIVSPGIDLRHPAIQAAIKHEIPLVGDVELFCLENSQPIIAVTGSNGKSTLCDCLGQVLQSLGVQCEVAGNFGQPVLDLLAQAQQPDVYVLELSSFQLETLSHLAADVAVVLNLSADHLDRHETLANYAQIKRRIYTQAKHIVQNADEALTQLSDANGPVLQFGQSADSDFVVTTNEAGYQIFYQGKCLLNESELQLKGLHNGLNIAACLAILLAYGIELNSNLYQALADYRGLAHRCQPVASDDDILWINDSKATNTGASLAAINSYTHGDGRLFLIAGGDAKGADIDELIPAIEQQVEHLWVYGKDAALFTNKLDATRCSRVSDLTQAVNAVKTIAQAGDRVLFSPACASLDMYSNYQQRGEHFMALVTGEAQ